MAEEAAAGVLTTPNQEELAPRERTDTLPAGVPSRTLGLIAAAWMIDNLVQPNGPKAGGPFVPTDRQIQFLVQFYALDEDGRFIYRHGVRRLAKGSGKSPFAAALALFELLGPCRFDHWDPDAPFGVVARKHAMALVQVVATAEAQTANTMRMIRRFSKKGSKLREKYDLDGGKTYIETDDGDRLEQVTSSAHTLEGAEVSFVVADETEHWTPNRGGRSLMNTLLQNSAKVQGSRVLETSNAWVPGEQSVAENTFDAWCDQEEGLTRGDTKILYDAIMAPPNTILTDDETDGYTKLTDALEYVYQDCSWVDIRRFREQIWSTDYDESRARRFFLNRPNAAMNSWCPLEEWTLLRDTHRVVRESTYDTKGAIAEKGEDIVMFFDGSKSNDHTALVGCCMEDGHVFKIGHWKPERNGNVDVAKVDAGVRQAFKRWNVVAFWADVREWESFVRTAWPDEFGEDLICHAVKGEGMSAGPIAWDMRSHAYQFAQAVETCYSEIQQKAFTQDGDAKVGEHVSNCRVNEFRGLISVKKESPKSQKKIDLAVCVIGARMLYRVVRASSEYADMSKPKKKAWGFIR